MSISQFAMTAKGYSFRCSHRRALLFARNLARSYGLVLRRFEKLPGDPEGTSSIGPEWVAFDSRSELSSASVWFPSGEENINRALAESTVCKVFDGRLFAISIRKRGS